MTSRLEKSLEQLCDFQGGQPQVCIHRFMGNIGVKYGKWNNNDAKSQSWATMTLGEGVCGCSLMSL